jgi:hypothetical protein
LYSLEWQSRLTAAMLALAFLAVATTK